MQSRNGCFLALPGGFLGGHEGLGVLGGIEGFWFLGASGVSGFWGAYRV